MRDETSLLAKLFKMWLTSAFGNNRNFYMEANGLHY